MAEITAEMRLVNITNRGRGAKLIGNPPKEVLIRIYVKETRQGMENIYLNM